MDYDSYVAQVANLMATDPTTPEFQIMLPGMINYSEKRIYRELDVVDTIWTSSTTCTPGTRVVIPPPAIISPASGLPSPHWTRYYAT